MVNYNLGPGAAALMKGRNIPKAPKGSAKLAVFC